MIPIPSALDEEGAYIIGALLGDKSSVSKNYNVKQKKWAYHVSLVIGNDYDFGQRWLECCSKIQERPVGFIYRTKGRNWWIACAYSKRVYQYVTQFIDGK